MSSFYDGQGNYFKKMLDLQEKLRKSEEERIRLEERFNLLVQESRNRHQDCINRLRFRYAEFLEEQRARDLRNNKILENLAKVDNSLVLMTAKTEKLNIVRKQYEAYLLRVYGNQRYGGSVTADSGLESQNEQEIPPSPIISKSIQPISKISYPYLNQNFAPSTYKTVNSSNENLPKLSDLRPSELVLHSNFKYSQTSSPLLCEDPSEVLKNRLLLSRYLDNSLKSSSNIFKSELQNDEHILKNSSLTLPEANNLSFDQELDRYLGKIKRMHIVNPNQSSEQERKHEQSFDEADYEQNTSGDLLNITLSSDVLEPSAFEEANKDRCRIRKARQLYAAQNTPIDYAEKIRELHNVPISDVSVGKDLVCDLKTPTVDKFREPEIARYQSSQPRDVKSLMQNPIDEVLTEFPTSAEPPQLVHRQTLDFSLADGDSPLLGEQEQNEQDSAGDEPSYQEFKDDGDGCIEDDYDDTVDIDSWMPDDVDDVEKDNNVQSNILDRPRRKLESIEEVEQDPEDEDLFEQSNEDGRIHFNRGQSLNRDTDSAIIERTGPIDIQTLQVDDRIHSRADVEYINNQHRYDDNENVQQQQQEDNAEMSNYYEKYDEKMEQFYEYTGDPNSKRSEYQNQQQAKEMYGEYIKEENQRKNQRSDNTNQEDEKYELDDKYNERIEPVQVFNIEKIDENEHDSSVKRDDLKEDHQELEPESIVDSNEADEDSEFADNIYIEEILADKQSRTNLKEKKENSMTAKKKDVIKSILDSDSESFIERNLSNTESDFDFN